MKALVVCTLLLVLPLAGVRMVCLNPETPAAIAAAPAPRAEQAAAETDEDDCSKFCLLPDGEAGGARSEAQGASSEARDARREAGSGGAMTCALEADPTCAFVLTTAVAVMPIVLAASVPSIVATEIPAVQPAYAAPVLQQHNPPPKALAL